MTTDTKACSKIVVTTGYDDMWNSPPQDQWDTMYEVVHFDKGYHGYEDSDGLLLCAQEYLDEDGMDYLCERYPYALAHDPSHPDFLHKFIGDMRIAFSLEGYSGSPRTHYSIQAPWNEGYIGDRIDGVLLVKYAFWDEYSQASEEQRRAIAEGELEAYEQWANGEIFWFSAVRITEVDGECDSCGRPHDDIEEEIDSCGGIYGHDALEEAIKEAVGDEEYELKEEY